MFGGLGFRILGLGHIGFWVNGFTVWDYWVYGFGCRIVGARVQGLGWIHWRGLPSTLNP